MEDWLDWITAVGVLVAAGTGIWLTAIAHLQARAQSARPEPVVEPYQSLGSDVWDGWTVLGMTIRHHGPASISIDSIRLTALVDAHILDYNDVSGPDGLGGMSLSPAPPAGVTTREVRFERFRVLAGEPDRKHLGRITLVVDRRPLTGAGVELALIWHWTDQPRRSRRTSIQI